MLLILMGVVHNFICCSSLERKSIVKVVPYIILVVLHEFDPELHLCEWVLWMWHTMACIFVNGNCECGIQWLACEFVSNFISCPTSLMLYFLDSNFHFLLNFFEA